MKYGDTSPRGQCPQKELRKPMAHSICPLVLTTSIIVSQKGKLRHTQKQSALAPLLLSAKIGLGVTCLCHLPVLGRATTHFPHFALCLNPPVHFTWQLGGPR